MSVVHSGSCHCGAVKWSCEAPAEIEAISCNCSICVKKQNHHFIVAKGNFKLLQGEDNLTTYTFNKGIAQHKFCRICGVQSFYIPRSNPDSVGQDSYAMDELYWMAGLFAHIYYNVRVCSSDRLTEGERFVRRYRYWY
ncbi:centromere protein V-like protein [Aphelenchoides avenae]|nr:centromere protein V-like protein [Aphelenchus avenae]